MKIPGLLLSLALLVLFACMAQDPEKKNEFSLGALAPTLKDYDSVRVLLVKPDGDTLLIFHGSAKDAESLQNLPAPGYDGGAVVLRITGYAGGKETYRTERGYDGNTHAVDSVKTLRTPSMGITFAAAPTDLLVGEEQPLPEATVLPKELSDKGIVWTSSEPKVIVIQDGRYKAILDGRSTLTASLKADTSKQASFTVTAREVDVTNAPESLELQPDTLDLSVGGGVRGFLLKVLPNSADGSVTWHSADTSKARFKAAGEVEGLAAGVVKVWAASRLKPSVTDTAIVKVRAEAKIESVRFDREVLKIFRGGARESLLVVVLPPDADQAVDFAVSDPSILEVQGGKVDAKAAGPARIIASSRKDPSRKDTLDVEVAEPEVVNSVSIEPDSLKLYKGGIDGQLKAVIDPAKSNQGVIWRSSQPSVATVDSLGKVHPLADGATSIRAVSKLDSTRFDEAKVTVKTDRPILNVNKSDTNVSLGATVNWHITVGQDYGGIASFQWSLDGDTLWDGTSTTVSDRDYTYKTVGITWLRLRVVDGEGNVEAVAKRINVVKGKVVNITSPANGLITNLASVPVAWTVDGVAQTTQLAEALKSGPNTITRSVTDSAGKLAEHKVTVTRDTVPPAAPIVKPLTYTNDSTPEWKWSSGGQGGHGLYRVALDTAALAGPGFRDTVYSPASPVKEGTRVLKIQERDSAGNWSPAALCSIFVDLTPPAAPTVVSAKALTNQTRPTWTWNSNGSKRYKVRLNSVDLSSVAETVDTAYTPVADLAEGTHTLNVSERDAVGNWSKPGSFAVRIDLTKPPAPVIAALPTPLNTLKPTWSITGGVGGAGTFRAKMDTADLTSATPFTSRNFIPAANLTEGAHTVYVQEQDSAGNWSLGGTRSVTLVLRAPVGTAGFGTGASELDFAISATGSPYILIKEATGAGKTSAYQYQAASGWGGIGFPAFSANEATDVSLAIDSKGNPWASWGESLINSVMWYSGGKWATPSPPLGEGHGPIAFTPKGVAYHVFSDRVGYIYVDSLTSPGEDWGRVSASPGYAVGASSLEIKANSKGELFVGFADRTTGQGARAKVMKLKPSATATWTEVGTGLPSDSANSLELAFAPGSDLPLLSVAHRGKLTVYLATAAGTWTAQGPIDFANTRQASLSVMNNSPVVAYIDPPTGKAHVRALANGAWASMSGTAGISYDAAWSVRVVTHPLLGIPWVAFVDAGKNDKTVVMQASFDPP